MNEINGGMCTTREIFFRACYTAAILGTVQASYTSFEFLGQDTMELVQWEALIGVSITGIMDNPAILLNPEILREGARIVKETNETIANIIGINPAARCCTIKPSGNASVLLGTSSGIHPAHSHKYFRIMQMNKNTEIGKLLSEINPDLLEEGVWSAHNTDYAVYIPVEEPNTAITKDNMSDVMFLNVVSVVYEHWVMAGHRQERGWSEFVTHNVSNTITVNDWDEVFDHIYHHQQSFCGLSFIPALGDKIYKQAPFTKVLNFDEIIDTYGEGSMFASGLIVDALHAFHNDLWDACEATVNRKYDLTGDRVSVLIKKDVVRRIKQFAKNYFKSDIDKTIECLKDVHLFHKWQTINRKFKRIDFTEIDLKPNYTAINETGGLACSSGGSCEIVRI